MIFLSRPLPSVDLLAVCVACCILCALDNKNNIPARASVENWTVQTKTRKNGLCINASATFTLQQRTPPGTFEWVCGWHHEALADVKGVRVIVYDSSEHGVTGLWQRIFRSKYDVCESAADL